MSDKNDQMVQYLEPIRYFTCAFPLLPAHFAGHFTPLQNLLLLCSCQVALKQHVSDGLGIMGDSGTDWTTKQSCGSVDLPSDCVADWVRMQAAKKGLWEKEAPSSGAALAGTGSGVLFEGTVVEVVSGDTLVIKTSTGQQIRMSLARCARQAKSLCMHGW
jgi:hypothetical protein